MPASCIACRPTAGKKSPTRCWTASAASSFSKRATGSMPRRHCSSGCSPDLPKKSNMRTDGRKPDELRPLTFRRRYTRHAAGSVLARMGQTTVLCTCSIELAVPHFLLGTGKGWLTAEYSMLPGSTSPRKTRDRAGKIDGRSVEIQRLIGRSLRAVVDLEKLGERTLYIDCDVLEADGGTRTAAINGAYIALMDALLAGKTVFGPPRKVIRGSVAAISVGLLDDK